MTWTVPVSDVNDEIMGIAEVDTQAGEIRVKLFDIYIARSRQTTVANPDKKTNVLPQFPALLKVEFRNK